MKRKIFTFWLLTSLFIFFITGSVKVKVVNAFNLITAKEAYDLVINGGAVLIDLRTTEECGLTGSPAQVAGGQSMAYVIPWKLYNGIGQDGKVSLKENPDFDALIKQTFDDNKNQTLIVMCASGIRSTSAAERLEYLGFTSVYEIDNYLKEQNSYPGGRGGFQGPGYEGEFNGYKGYPGRLANESGPAAPRVQTMTANIQDENDSVSWMDAGLPITYTLDQNKIPKIKKKSTTYNSSLINQYNSGYSIMPYYYNPWYYQFSVTDQFSPANTYRRGNLFFSPLVQDFGYLNQTGAQNSYLMNYPQYGLSASSSAFPNTFTSYSSYISPPPSASSSSSSEEHLCGG